MLSINWNVIWDQICRLQTTLLPASDRQRNIDTHNIPYMFTAKSKYHKSCHWQVYTMMLCMRHGHIEFVVYRLATDGFKDSSTLWSFDVTTSKQHQRRVCKALLSPFTNFSPEKCTCMMTEEKCTCMTTASWIQSLLPATCETKWTYQLSPWHLGL